MHQICIPEAEVCDLTDNCGLGEDEELCEGYQAVTLEDGGFGWWNQSADEDDMDYVLWSGATPYYSKYSLISPKMYLKLHHISVT